ncbi:hypothetical protein F4782DRAFT_479348 [Xylaria castorea]|nr:hypothetical protein F4782DRAFT_479348 [Xylaria castorea]
MCRFVGEWVMLSMHWIELFEFGLVSLITKSSTPVYVHSVGKRGFILFLLLLYLTSISPPKY